MRKAAAQCLISIAIIIVLILTISWIRSVYLIDKDTKLREAASNGDLAEVAKLLNEGVDVNNFGPAYGTAILYAAGNGHRDIVELLIKRGADVNVKNGFGDTPLISAASRGFDDIVKLLIEKGADVAAQNDFGENAYRIAIENKHYSTASLIWQSCPPRKCE